MTEISLNKVNYSSSFLHSDQTDANQHELSSPFGWTQLLLWCAVNPISCFNQPPAVGIKKAGKGETRIKAALMIPRLWVLRGKMRDDESKQHSVHKKVTEVTSKRNPPRDRRMNSLPIQGNIGFNWTSFQPSICAWELRLHILHVKWFKKKKKKWKMRFTFLFALAVERQTA